MQRAPGFSSWTPRHAGLCTVLGVVSALLESPAPLALGGAASLAAFLVKHKPASVRLGGLGVANAITLLRLGLVVAAALAAPTWWAFGVVLVLDGLDGVVARRLDEASDFGAHFDMETDALFVAVLSLASLVAGAPPWVLLFGALRYAFVLTRLLFPVEAPRERRSQFGRFVFVGAVSALLFSLTEAPLPLRLASLACGLVALLASFSQDFAALRRTA